MDETIEKITKLHSNSIDDAVFAFGELNKLLNSYKLQQQVYNEKLSSLETQVEKLSRELSKQVRETNFFRYKFEEVSAGKIRLEDIKTEYERDFLFKDEEILNTVDKYQLQTNEKISTSEQEIIEQNYTNNIDKIENNNEEIGSSHPILLALMANQSKIEQEFSDPKNAYKSMILPVISGDNSNSTIKMKLKDPKRGRVFNYQQQRVKEKVSLLELNERESLLPEPVQLARKKSALFLSKIFQSYRLRNHLYHICLLFYYFIILYLIY